MGSLDDVEQARYNTGPANRNLSSRLTTKSSIYNPRNQQKNAELH